MESLTPQERYEFLLGANNKSVPGVYLGNNRILIRTGKNDFRDIEGTPRIYNFREFSLEEERVRLPEISLSRKLTQDEIRQAEFVLDTGRRL